MYKLATNEVTPLCQSQIGQSTCNGGTNYHGIEELQYQGSFFFQFGNELCYDWIASFELCCRASNIENLAGPQSTAGHVSCPIRPQFAPCNSSPRFNTPGVIFGCVGQALSYNPGAYDQDGDSLSYELVPTYSYSGGLPTYWAPFSATYPLKTSTGSVDFDSLTGTISFIPDSAMISSVRFRVKEYRCGNYIGYVDREIRVDIKNCSNSMPQIAGGGYNTISNGVALDTNTFFVSPGSTLNFTITASDFDTGQSVSMIPDPVAFPDSATFVTTGNNPVTGTFNWNTMGSDSGYYAFTITVNDSACPAFGINIYYFEIFVGIPAFPPPPDLSAVVSPPAGFNFSSGSINLSVNSGKSPFEYSWSNSDSIEDPSGLAGGAYSVVVTDDRGCFATDTFTVPTCVAAVELGGDTTVCTGTLTIDAGAGMSAYTWCGGQNTQSVVATSPGQYCVVVADSIGCFATDTLQLSFGNPPTVSLGPDTSVCANSGFSLSPAGIWTAYLWSDSTTAPTLSINSAGTYGVTVADTNGCEASDSVNISLLPAPLASYTYSKSGLNVNFTDGSTNAVAWLWTFGDGDSDTSQSPNYTYLNDGAFSVCLQVTDSNGCKDDTCEWIAVVSTAKPLSNEIKLFPIPAKDRLNIRFKNKTAEPLSIKLSDALGRKTYHATIPSGQTYHSIKTHSISSGIYFIRIAGKSGFLSQKVQIER